VEFISVVTARSRKIASLASPRWSRSRSARCRPQSTIRSPALRASTGSLTRCSRWPSVPRSKGTGTTPAAGFGYGCPRCGLSDWPSSRSIRSGRHPRRRPPCSSASSMRSAGWRRDFRTCRQALSDQPDAILENASALVALDRRDLDMAWQRAHAALEPMPQPASVIPVRNQAETDRKL